jgi:glycosyltransferase involved in cell wall biosynthesis
MNLLPHARSLDRLMKRFEFPIVHLNDSPLLPAAWVARRHGARVVWHLRSALAGEGLDRRSRRIIALMQRWGDTAIAIDDDVAARFRLGLDVRIVFNSVRGPTVVPPPDAARQNLRLPTDRVLVGFAGFIRRPKGWPEFVEAAAIMIQQGVPAHFVIMGGGVRPPEYFRTLSGRVLAFANVLADEETAIQELVSRKGLNRHFSFLPFTPETGEIYSALDILAFPNQGVGLGRPVLEAAMYGKPVVASGSATGGGVLIDGVTGLLVANPDGAEIATTLTRLIGDPELRTTMGRAAANHARVNFDAVTNARAVEAIYDELLGNRAPEAEDACAERVEAQLLEPHQSPNTSVGTENDASLSFRIPTR